MDDNKDRENRLKELFGDKYNNKYSDWYNKISENVEYVRPSINNDELNNFTHPIGVKDIDKQKLCIDFFANNLDNDFEEQHYINYLKDQLIVNINRKDWNNNKEIKLKELVKSYPNDNVSKLIRAPPIIQSQNLQNLNASCFVSTALQLLYRIWPLSWFITHDNIIGQYSNNINIKKKYSKSSLDGIGQHDKPIGSTLNLYMNVIKSMRTCESRIEKNTNIVNNIKYSEIDSKRHLLGFESCTSQEDSQQFLINILQLICDVDCAENDISFNKNKNDLCEQDDKNSWVSKYKFKKNDPRSLIKLVFLKYKTKYPVNYNTEQEAENSDEYQNIKDTNNLKQELIKVLYENMLIIYIHDSNIKSDLKDLVGTSEIESIIMRNENDNNNSYSVHYIQDKYEYNKYIIIYLNIFIYSLSTGVSSRLEYVGKLADDDGFLDIGNKRYELIVINMHHGNMMKGHYTALIKYFNKWYYYDDLANDYKEHNITNFKYPILEEKIPYLLLFRRVDDEPELLLNPTLSDDIFYYLEEK